MCLYQGQGLKGKGKGKPLADNLRPMLLASSVSFSLLLN
jgi:hypothetical protein